MRDILLTLTIFGSVPLILIKPHIGVLVFSWISYMNPHRLTWGFAYDFQFAFLIGAVTVLAWVISREPKRLPLNGVTMLLIVFTLWVSFTTLFALYPDQAYIKWEQTIKILLFNGFITLALMRSKERINALVWVIVLSIGFFALKGGVFTLMTGGTYRVWGPHGTFIGGNNELALATVMIIPLVRYLQLSSSRRLITVGLAILLACCVITVLGSHSRGGFVALIAMLLSLLLKTRRRILIGSGIGLMVIALFLFMPESWHGRMETIVTYDQDGSVQGRFRAWEYGLEAALQSPIVGGGFAAFQGNLDPTSSVGYRTSHSIYFEVLGEHGFVGLALFLALGIASFLAGTSVMRKVRGRADLQWAGDLAGMIQVSFIGFATAGIVTGLAFFDLVYHLVVIMVLTAAVVKKSLSTAARESGHQRILDHAAQSSPG